MRSQGVWVRVFLRGVLVVIFSLCMVGVSSIFAQGLGGIIGVVADPSGAVVAGATVTVTDVRQGTTRTVQTNASGQYVVPALVPDDYEVSVQSTGFKKSVTQVTVEVGVTATANFALVVGAASETVTVQGNAPAVTTGGGKQADSVTAGNVSQLPLNGRNVLELSKLSANIVMTASSGRNSEFSLGVSGVAAVTVLADGINESDYFSATGVAYNISMDAVGEFQVNTNNGDPSNGIGQGGTISIVTRSGGDQFHGSGWGFFRNNQYAAYPGLSHPPVVPNPNGDALIAQINQNNASPAFHRYQYGVRFGGPLFNPDKHVFFFGSFENSPAIAITAFTGGAPFNALNDLIPQVHNRRQQDYRVDWHASDRNSFFWRVLSDRVTAEFVPAGLASSANLFYDKVFSYEFGWTRVLRPNLVSAFRIGFDLMIYDEQVNPEAFTEAQLYAPALINQTAGQYPLQTTAPWMGFMSVLGTNMVFGDPTTGHDNEALPRSQISENLTWTKGNHTISFGGRYEREPWYIEWWTNQPAAITLFNPAQAAAAGIPVPATFNTLADVLQLPVNTFSMGIGDANQQTGSFQGANVHTPHEANLFAGDVYRVNRKLTANYAVSWSYLDHTTDWDMPKPAILGKVFNGDLNPTPNWRKGVSPSIGFSWDVTGSGKTVIRGGSGMYFGFITTLITSAERALVSPFGDGYIDIAGTHIANPLPGGGFLNYPNAAANKAAGVVTAAALLPFVPGIRAAFNNQFTNSNTNLSFTNFDNFKGTSATGGNTGGVFVAPQYRPPTSVQNNLGVEHLFGNDWLLSVTGVYNQLNHTSFSADLNKFERPAANGGPVDPNLGYVDTDISGGNGTFKALNVKVTKRLSNHWSLNAGYALSRMWDHASAQIFDYTNPASNYGPDTAQDRTHSFILNSLVQLPKGFDVSIVSNTRSPLPINAYLSGVDLRGDGMVLNSTNDLLPGVPYDSLNRSTSTAALTAAVANFNTTYAGTLDARGTLIPKINLPATYRFGRVYEDQDVRLTKTFKMRSFIKEQPLSLQVMAECFNVLNYGNLLFVAAGGNLYSGAFGQPAQRVNSTLGSGGPRAFQFGIRGSF